MKAQVLLIFFFLIFIGCSTPNSSKNFVRSPANINFLRHTKLPATEQPVGCTQNCGLVAPYFFTWAYNNDFYGTTSLMQAKQNAGLKAATIAFGITKGTCAFDGAVVAMQSDITQFLKTGGKLIISLGGALGTYIETACTNETSLFNAIDNLIISTGVKNLDFDIEGSQLNNSKVHLRRARVIALLQQKYPDLYVSYTLPVSFNKGLSSQSLSVITTGISLNVKVNVINLMTMDYYQDLKGKTMGDAAIESAEQVVVQLQAIYSGKTKNEIYRMLGITPMIGTNDDHTVFTTTDAVKVRNYALDKKIALLSYWGFQRDRSGGSDLNAYSLANEYNFQFYEIFKVFEKSR